MGYNLHFLCVQAVFTLLGIGLAVSSVTFLLEMLLPNIRQLKGFKWQGLNVLREIDYD